MISVTFLTSICSTCARSWQDHLNFEGWFRTLSFLQCSRSAASSFYLPLIWTFEWRRSAKCSGMLALRGRSQWQWRWIDLRPESVIWWSSIAIGRGPFLPRRWELCSFSDWGWSRGWLPSPQRRRLSHWHPHSYSFWCSPSRYSTAW